MNRVNVFAIHRCINEGYGLIQIFTEQIRISPTKWWRVWNIVVFVCFHDLKFHLGSQLNAASCAWYNSEMPPSKQATGTRSQYASLFGIPHSRRLARRCNPTHACCCSMVLRLIGTCLAGSNGYGAGPFPGAGW